MNQVEWIDVARLSLMTVFPLLLRLGISKKLWAEIFSNKPLLLKMGLFWLVAIIVIFAVCKFFFMTNSAWDDALKIALVIVITLGFRWLFLRPALLEMLKDKATFFKVTLLFLCFAGFIFLVINWLM